MNIKRISREELFYFSIYVVSFSLPFDSKFSNSALAISGALWLFAIPQLQLSKNWKQFGIPLLLFSSLYFINIIGLVHTQNFDAASNWLQSRLVYFVFPILILLSNTGKTELRRSGYFFCLGVLVSSLVCFAINYYEYIQPDSMPPFEVRFTYIELLLPLDIHPNFYSIFISFSMLFLISEIAFEKHARATRLCLGACLIYFLFLNFLVQSRAPLTAFGVILILGIGYWFVVYKHIHKGVLIGVAIIIISGIALFISNKDLLGRFSVSANTIQEIMFKPDSTIDTSPQNLSTLFHFRSWHCSFLLLSDHHFFTGYGTGDEKDALVECYQSYQWTHMVEVRLSAHNEYLSALMRNGLVEFLLLVGVLMVPFFISLRSDQLLYASFLLLWILVILFCSLNRQSALSFYALFNALFYKAMIEHRRLRNLEKHV